MLTEIGAENNTTTIVMMPSDFINAARRLSESHPGAPNSSAVQPFNPEVFFNAKKPEENDRLAKEEL